MNDKIDPKYHFLINLGLLFIMLGSFNLVSSIIVPVGTVTHGINGLFFVVGLTVFTVIKRNRDRDSKLETWRIISNEK